jgi:hypothetical protein
MRIRCAGTILGGALAIVMFSACASDKAGTTDPSNSTTPSSAKTFQSSGTVATTTPPVTSAPPTIVPITTVPVATANIPSTSASVAPVGPAIDSSKVDAPSSCKVGALVSPKLTWSTSGGVTGMAISVDQPGTVGSYGTYGKSGSLTMPAIDCAGAVGSTITHVYSLTTVGDGKAASKNITVAVKVTA